MGPAEGGRAGARLLCSLRLQRLGQLAVRLGHGLDVLVRHYIHTGDHVAQGPGEQRCAEVRAAVTACLRRDTCNMCIVECSINGCKVSVLLYGTCDALA